MYENAKILVLGYSESNALCSTKIQFFQQFRTLLGKTAARFSQSLVLLAQWKSNH